MVNKKYKVCNKCGTENTLKAVSCANPNCNSDKFAPEYITKLEPITRNTFVQVTLPQDKKRKELLYTNGGQVENLHLTLTLLNNGKRLGIQLKLKFYHI